MRLDPSRHESLIFGDQDLQSLGLQSLAPSLHVTPHHDPTEAGDDPHQLGRSPQSLVAEESNAPEASRLERQPGARHEATHAFGLLLLALESSGDRDYLDARHQAGDGLGVRGHATEEGEVARSLGDSKKRGDLERAR